MESNDSPEIQDRGETSGILGFPLGATLEVHSGTWMGTMPRALKSQLLTGLKSMKNLDFSWSKVSIVGCIGDNMDILLI